MTMQGAGGGKHVARASHTYRGLGGEEEEEEERKCCHKDEWQAGWANANAL